MNVFMHLRSAQLGVDREVFAKDWAEALLQQKPWAQSLNHDRLVVEAWLNAICACWDQKEVSLSAQDVIETIGDTKLHQAVKLCLVMDRALSLSNQEKLRKSYFPLVRHEDFRPLGLYNDPDLRKWTESQN